MKKFLSACAVFFGCVQGALAADAVDSAPTYVAYDWSGFYLGVNGGYAWADTETSENSITTTGPLVGVGPGTFPPGTIFTGPDRSGEMDGAFGGIQAGYNVQNSSWVYGVEADYQYASIHGSESFLGTPDEGPSYETSAELRHFGTLRGRLAYAFDTILVYGTAGLAVGRLETDINITGGLPDAPTGPTFSSGATETLVGYALGGGVEAAIGRSNWTVKGEYLYADFGGEDFNLSFPDSDGSTAFGHTEVDAHLLRIGLNYRF